MSFGDSNKAEFDLENEIRKLKLQLLKEELSDKLIVLNSYLDNKRSDIRNSTPSQDVVDISSSHVKYESVLFANVSGEFLVWHIVLIVLIFWVLTAVCLNYLRGVIYRQRAKYKRRKSIKIRKRNKLMKKQMYEDSLKVAVIDVADIRNERDENDEDDEEKSGVCSNVYSNETFSIDQLESNFLPSRKEFFLYTIDEHEAFSNRIFTARKKSLTNNTSLSKSDTNLYKY